MVMARRPASLGEALALRRDLAAVPFAGGTDLMVKLRRGPGVTPAFDRPVLFLDKVRELRRIESRGGFLEIGAMATLAELAASLIVPETLKAVAMEMAGPAIRNVATLGGNVCNASPAGDTLPLLYAFDAFVRLASPRRWRTLPIGEFIRGPGATALASDELLVSVLVPEWRPHVSSWRKVGTRRANALTKVSFAGFVEWSGRRIARARLALGAVAPAVVRLHDAERMLEGAPPEEVGPMLEAIVASVRPAVRPIDDQRSTAAYRRRVAENLVRELVLRLAAERSADPAH